MAGQHNTHVANNYLKEVSVAVTHPNGRQDRFTVEHGKVRNVATERGTVSVAVYDPENPSNPNPVEQRSIPSDISVMVVKTPSGRPRIVKVVYGTLWKADPYDNE